MIKKYQLRKGEEVKKIYVNGIRIDLNDSEDVCVLPKATLGVEVDDKTCKVVIETEITL